jgi:hypothetical protein
MDLGDRAEKLMDSRVATLPKFEPTEQRYKSLRKYAL